MNNLQVLEAGDYYAIQTIYLSQNDIISGEMNSAFTSDGFDYYLLDSVNYQKFENGQIFSAIVSKTGYSQCYVGFSSEDYTVTQDGTYYVVISAVDATDTISVSVYVDITYFTLGASSYPLYQLMGLGILAGILAFIAFIIAIPIIVVKRKRKNKGDQSIFTGPAQGYSTGPNPSTGSNGSTGSIGSTG